MSYGAPHPAGPAPAAPQPVRVAVALVYARIALTVLGVVLSAVYQDEVIAAAGMGGGEGAGLARTFAGLGLAVGVVFALIAIALWVVLAVFTGRGHGWARIVLTVLAGLGLLSALATVGSLALSAAAGLPQPVPLAVTAVQTLLSLALWAAIVVLLWRRASNAYFAAAGAHRAARRLTAG